MCLGGKKKDGERFNVNLFSLSNPEATNEKVFDSYLTVVVAVV